MNESGQDVPYVKILEQPSHFRFRYKCEGRPGSIPGVNSTPENRTSPSIQVVGYKGRAIVVVSCVTNETPPRPHPHTLAGSEGCKNGVCTLEIVNSDMSITFTRLGMHCVKKREIDMELHLREQIKVDPYKTGFAHRQEPGRIDLKCVRLCFQVFIEGNTPGKFVRSLQPVVSDPIYDTKTMSDLRIFKLSDYTCSVAGGKEIILLCEKIDKDDIRIHFYQMVDGKIFWEELAQFHPNSIHKNVAICFTCPKYKFQNVDAPVKVCIQLWRPSDDAISEPIAFDFLPLSSVDKRPERQNNSVITSLASSTVLSNYMSQKTLNNVPPVFDPKAYSIPATYPGRKYVSTGKSHSTINSPPHSSNGPYPTVRQNSTAGKLKVEKQLPFTTGMIMPLHALLPHKYRAPQMAHQYRQDPTDYKIQLHKTLADVAEDIEPDFQRNSPDIDIKPDFPIQDYDSKIPINNLGFPPLLPSFSALKNVSLETYIPNIPASNVPISAFAETQQVKAEHVNGQNTTNNNNESQHNNSSDLNKYSSESHMSVESFPSEIATLSGDLSSLSFSDETAPSEKSI